MIIEFVNCLEQPILPSKKKMGKKGEKNHKTNKKYTDILK